MAASALPLTATKVESVVREPITALALGGRTIPGRSGWVVTLEGVNGAQVVLDRLNDEPAGEWHVNGVWSAGRSMPVFWNGQLSRCTIPQMAGPQMSAAADAALAAELAR